MATIRSVHMTNVFLLKTDLDFNKSNHEGEEDVHIT